LGFFGFSLLGKNSLPLEMQCIGSATVILKTRRTKAELHIKGINKIYIQFAFKADFLLCLSNYVGSGNGKFSVKRPQEEIQLIDVL
jgi:hypothetical protein